MGGTREITNNLPAREQPLDLNRIDKLQGPEYQSLGFEIGVTTEGNS
jgi:hypothetical protein